MCLGKKDEKLNLSVFKKRNEGLSTASSGHPPDPEYLKALEFLPFFLSNHIDLEPNTIYGF